MPCPRPPHWGIRTLRDLLCGALIGAGAILPGVSGGVLAVVFGVYQPFMEALTHPRTAIPKYWRWAIPLGLGWAVGFLGLAKGIAAAMLWSQAATTWFFIGLILGTLPALFRDAGREGRPPPRPGCRRRHWVCSGYTSSFPSSRRLWKSWKATRMTRASLAI